MTKQISIPCSNYELQADWHEGSTNKQIIVTFVGFGSSKRSNFDFVATVVEKTGMSALVVDLSGHGESPFDVSETMPAQHVLEAVKAYDWLVAEYPESQIHVMGTSYGGFIAAYLTRFRVVNRIVLRTPAIYEPSMFYTQHQHIDKLLVREYRKDAAEVSRHPLFGQSALGTLQTLVVVHGSDESVPAQTTDVYAEAFGAEKYVAAGFVHAFRDPANPQDAIPEYYEVVAAWFTGKKL